MELDSNGFHDVMFPMASMLLIGSASYGRGGEARFIRDTPGGWVHSFSLGIRKRQRRLVSAGLLILGFSGLKVGYKRWRCSIFRALFIAHVTCFQMREFKEHALSNTKRPGFRLR